MSRRASPDGMLVAASPSRFTLFFRRFLVRASQSRAPRYLETAMLAFVLGGAGFVGAVHGGHMPAVRAFLGEVGDTLANVGGFRVVESEVRGHNRLRRDDILAQAGVTPTTSVAFFNAAYAREQLKKNPWIADAVIRKFYPSRIEIEVTEREAFALWQRDGKLAIVARDGTVLEEVKDRPEKLPLVVGEGAAQAAAEFLAVLERFPEIKKQVYGAVLVAQRRWNLRLVNGVDVRLPEGDVDAALMALTALARDQKILSRDISVIDLRISGQVVVRMSDAAAGAYDAQRKPAKPKGAS